MLTILLLIDLTLNIDTIFTSIRCNNYHTARNLSKINSIKITCNLFQHRNKFQTVHQMF